MRETAGHDRAKISLIRMIFQALPAGLRHLLPRDLSARVPCEHTRNNLGVDPREALVSGGSMPRDERGCQRPDDPARLEDAVAARPV